MIRPEARTAHCGFQFEAIRARIKAEHPGQFGAFSPRLVSKLNQPAPCASAREKSGSRRGDTPRFPIWALPGAAVGCRGLSVDGSQETSSPVHFAFVS
ncbi:hypothetical protein R1flu_016272 [Riccia fluitans]|uniref:Uncharacterized protein n=1 Tax=Riccia fluitans TaxID=41844 RepID=A0ABD1YLF0_9MARC